MRPLLRLSSHALAHPFAWLGGLLVATCILAPGLGRLRLRTDGAAIYPSGNPVIAQTERDRATFGDARELVVLITPRRGGAGAFESPAGLRFLARIHSSLGRLEGLHPLGVLSLARIPARLPARITDPFPGLLDTVPADPAGFTRLLAKVRADPIASGLFLAPGGEAAALYVNFEAGRAPEAIIAALESWAEAEEAPDFDLRVFGPLAAEATLGKTVLADLARLIPIVIAVVALALLLQLGSPGGVVIPLVEALLVLLWVLGAMGFAGSPITLVTTILPVVLMAMAITDEIHLLERFQAHLQAHVSGSSPSTGRERVGLALGATLEELVAPVVATTLTTAIAFLSFAGASIGPLRDFGLYAALGILLAMLLTFTLVPALIAVLPVSWLESRRARRLAAGRAGLLPWERWAARQGGRAWVPAALLLAAGVPGILGLAVQDSWVGNFDPGSRLATADRRFNEMFWGSYRLDVVFDADRWFFYRPEGVRLLEAATTVAQAGTHVGGVLSHLVPLAQVARVRGDTMRLARASEREIRRLGAGARLAVGGALIDQLVTRDGASARLRLFVNRADYERGAALEGYLGAQLPRLIEGTGVHQHLSGDLPVAVEVVRAIVTSQLRSIGWTLAGTALLLALVLGSPRRALLLMVPVLAADWIFLAGLGYARVPLGIATSMFASLTIGVGVDYAVHLAHGYRGALGAGAGHALAMARALEGTGRAIRWNAFTLATGFVVLGFSRIPPNRTLGLLLASSVIACYGTTLLFLPRLLARRTGAGEAFGQGQSGVLAESGAERSPGVSSAPSARTRYQYSLRSASAGGPGTAPSRNSRSPAGTDEAMRRPGSSADGPAR